MREKWNETAQVISQECLSEGIYSLWLKTENIAGAARPGQFVSLYCQDTSHLLPRPISICEVGEDSLRLVYRVAGWGTHEFSQLKAGDSVRVTGPLGNGFPLERAAGKKAVLMGGGIGVPPMLQLAKSLQALEGEATPAAVTAVLGYRNADTFLGEAFEKAAQLKVASEDGSVGTKGNVLDCMREQQIEAEVIFACGPMPMLRAIKAYAAERQIECWLSLEEKMACGIGACLSCVCRTSEKDAHSQVDNARICTEGPVFEAGSIEI
ncbi:MAG: dihydroorotate dehydrogenase electron transfer subunit [Lachnospiraceae bacterium]|nr:dihydroorotate dehydrogenase electron transfer subunit [Lachnospiraceae bacterium]